jgi:hypothetical protein
MYAGWWDPQNHRVSLGIYVRLHHSNGYNTFYGHMSGIAVQACGSIGCVSMPHGEFLGINNKTAIRERWEEKKPKLQQYYKGEKAEEIFKKIPKASPLLGVCLSDLAGIYLNAGESREAQRRAAEVLRP